MNLDKILLKSNTLVSVEPFNGTKDNPAKSGTILCRRIGGCEFPVNPVTGEPLGFLVLDPAVARGMKAGSMYLVNVSPVTTEPNPNNPASPYLRYSTACIRSVNDNGDLGKPPVDDGSTFTTKKSVFAEDQDALTQMAALEAEAKQLRKEAKAATTERKAEIESRLAEIEAAILDM